MQRREILRLALSLGSVPILARSRLGFAGALSRR